MKQVKFLSSDNLGSPATRWRRQLPDNAPVIGSCEFIFDPYCRQYDWLVVYDRFPREAGKRISLWKEVLACEPQNTLFITVEPSSIGHYEDFFLRQFGYVLTSHETWSINQPGVLRSQPGLRWFYGDGQTLRTIDEMRLQSAPEKPYLLSTVCSSKQHRHTLHNKRFQFTQRLKSDLPLLDIYGRGQRPIQNKADALDPYQYHLVIENHSCKHHWTEKIADAFLGWTFPFYYGCTNLEDYFPAGSYLEIDINNYRESLANIRDAINKNIYNERRESIEQARLLVLNKYNLFSVITALIEDDSRPSPNDPKSNIILSRHALRQSSPISALRQGVSKIRHRCHTFLG